MKSVLYCHQHGRRTRASAWPAQFLLCLACTVICLSLPWSVAAQVDRESLQKEEAQDYFRKWLDEDVFYIIMDEERSVFSNLTTLEEKEQFIEQFWYRRDPDPRTAINEFKEEHYRRLAYSNETFSSGKPGWQTDRGRIYIIHGPPAETEFHPTGGHLTRPLSEGGGSTTTYPFEVWRYRHIDGLGDDIVLEFVDKTMTGEYRLALLPDEKDALLYMPGGGSTVAELLGLATKADRPFFSPGNRDSYPGMIQSVRNNPFLRYETYSKVQGPRQIKYQDLKEIVEVDVSYDTLPMAVEAHYFRLGNGEVLVPVTFQLPNKNLSFQFQEGAHVARVAVYGIVTTVSKRVITEFEDELTLSYRDEVFAMGFLQESVYQKVLALEPGIRYRLDLVVKDLNSERIGVVSRGLIPPKFSDEVLQASPIILSNHVPVLLQEAPGENAMFVLGDVRIRPNIKKEFTRDLPMGVYFQLYNAGIDQTSLAPSLSVTYEILHNGSPLNSVTDSNGESTQFFSADRVVLIRRFDLSGLAAGDYRIRLKVHDRVADRRIELDDSFKLVESKMVAQSG